MSIRDHRQIQDSYSCIYCLETWPCRTARILIEASDWIRSSPELIDLTDDHMSDCIAAADLIDPR